jgi:hypothetical protein
VPVVCRVSRRHSPCTSDLARLAEDLQQSAASGRGVVERLGDLGDSGLDLGKLPASAVPIGCCHSTRWSASNAVTVEVIL